MIFPTFSEQEIELQFRAFMNQLGVSPAPYESLILDGSLHRFDILGDKRGSNNGAYLIHPDGIPAGFVQDWKRGVKANWTFDTSGLPQDLRNSLNSDEYKKKALELQRQRDLERQKKQSEAVQRAIIISQTMKTAPEDHPYLKAKSINPYGVLADGNRLVIPLRDIDGNVKSVQWINHDGTKRFLPDATLSGLFWSIALDTVKPNDDAIILLGEGFATMAKVYELTGMPSVAGIACGYLEEVAKVLKSRFSKCKIICTADNDIATEARLGRNPGLEAARYLKNSGLIYDFVAPHFDNAQDGSDWDDFAIIHGVITPPMS